MDENQFNKLIGYALAIIISYYILGYFIQYLIWGAVGLTLWRIFFEYQKRK